jgi:hypothetical protein
MDNGGPGLLNPVSKLDRRRTGRVRKRNNLLTGKGGGDWEGAKSYTPARKPGPLLFIQYSLARSHTFRAWVSYKLYGQNSLHYTNVYDVERSSRRQGL